MGNDLVPNEKLLQQGRAASLEIRVETRGEPVTSERLADLGKLAHVGWGSFSA
jgi:hypothetical protein